MREAPTADYILCECPLENLKNFTEKLSVLYIVKLLKPPGICLTMVRAEDSVEKQEFYLGEALTTDCEVEINGKVGYGICLGDEPERAYCMAIIEAVMKSEDENLTIIQDFFANQLLIIQEQEREEFAQIMRTKVDFKLLEQS